MRHRLPQVMGGACGATDRASTGSASVGRRVEVHAVELLAALLSPAIAAFGRLGQRLAQRWTALRTEAGWAVFLGLWPAQVGAAAGR